MILSVENKLLQLVYDDDVEIIREEAFDLSEVFDSALTKEDGVLLSS